MRAAREIAARESPGDSSLTAGADQRDFEGPSGERLRAGAHAETSVMLRAPAAGCLPLAAMSEEQGRQQLLSQQNCDERSSDGPVLTWEAGPERADEGGGPTPGRP